MIGKKRIDLAIDPPPDLAIEVDVTSKTQLSVYESLAVPELWRYQSGKLRIDLFEDNKYVESSTSNTFPDFPISETILRFMEMSETTGTSSAMREFRRWVRAYLQERSTS
jgi:Uma2 family endonuclease